jgi:DNA replication protein DnaC
MSESFAQLIARMRAEADAAVEPSVGTPRAAKVRDVRMNLWQAARVPPRLATAKLEHLEANIKAGLASWLDADSGDILTLLGKVGTGKSYAAVAVAREVILRIDEADLLARRAYAPSPVLFVSWVDLLASVRAFNRGDDPVGSAAGFRGCLIVDDLGAAAATDFAKEQLFRLIDSRYRDCLRTVLTADLEVAVLGDKLGDRVASRMLSGTVLKIQGSDRRLSK